MPDLPKLPGDNADAELQKADQLAEQLLAASRNGAPEKPSVSPDREAELDAEFKKALSDTPAPDAAPKPAEEAKPVETPAPEEKKPDAPAPTPVDDGKRKGLLDDLIPETAKPEPTPFEKASADIKLRSDASPKTVDSFNQLKTAAAAQIAAERETASKLANEKAELAKQLEELKGQVGKNTPEAEAELKELREFRALHDVGSRPEFKEKFDSRIDANDNAVYDLFKQEGMKDEVIAELRKMSADNRADYIEKNVLPNLTSGQKRFVEAKILENVNVLGEKSKALEQAKADADKIISEQRGLPQKQEQERVQRLATHLKGTLMKLPFFHPKEIPATATAAEKAAIEAHNASALELQATMRAAVLDNSPEAAAEAALAVPLAKHFKAQYQSALARAEQAETELAAIKKAGSTGRRLGASAAPAGSQPPAPKPSSEMDAVDAVDALFREATTHAA